MANRIKVWFWRKGLLRKIGTRKIIITSAVFICLMFYNYNLSLPSERVANAKLILNVTGLTSSKSYSDRDLFYRGRIPMNINCSALIQGELRVRGMAIFRSRRKSVQYIPDHDYIEATKDCKYFKESRGYITSHLTDEEELFSIAYTIMAYENVNQVERLLRAIYRPQHYICIHVDTKSTFIFQRAIKGIIKCFDNVILSSRSFSVDRGSFNIILADLQCMRDLWKFKNWKYLMNLAAHEFPLRTNYELVKILKTLNGSNHIEGMRQEVYNRRWENVPAPPFHIVPVKGSMHLTASRGYIDFVLHNPLAMQFLTWTKGTRFPEETFFSSLHYNSHLNVPGHYEGTLKKTNEIIRFFGRFVNWLDWEIKKGFEPKVVSHYECHGKFVHGLCVFGARDLPLLTTRPEFFLNKFHSRYQPYAMDCMEEWHFNRTRDQYLEILTFNTSIYTNQYGWNAG